VTEELDTVIEHYHRAAQAFARGDPDPIKALFSHTDDVLLANPFGPAVTGWAAASDRLDFASSRMHDGDVSGFDELARYVCDDLVVLHETEHWSSRVADRPRVEPFQLRVTTTFRHEKAQWRIVHRHADPITTVHEQGPLRSTPSNADDR
jgi:ketosteroid isomerase-like protein